MHKIKFKIDGKDKFVEINIEKFSTVFGITFVAISDKYKKLKKGDFLINPFNGKKIIVVNGDYFEEEIRVGVPAHNEEDFKFAKENDLEIKQVIAQEFLGWGNGKGLPKKEVKTLNKEGVAVVLLNKKENKVLTIKWKHSENWISFITGGIEKGESPVEAAFRELEEETGYIDVEYLGKNLIRKTNNFHPGKNVNYSSIANGLLFKLKSDKKINISEEEKAKHDLEWIDILELKDILTFDDHKVLVEQFFEKETPFLGKGVLVNSGKFDGLKTEEAEKEIKIFSEENNILA